MTLFPAMEWLKLGDRQNAGFRERVLLLTSLLDTRA